MTTADAARIIGVSVRQVQRLIEAGEIEAIGRIGGYLRLDPSSVRQLAQRGSQRGRPWLPDTAWAALELVEDGTTTRLNTAQRSRLRTRLRSIDVDELVRLARRRADNNVFRTSASTLTRLAGHVTLTGESAIDADRGMAGQFDLVAGRGNRVDGYIWRELLDDYRREFFLADDAAGNVTLRAMGDDTRSRSIASTAVVALDLAETLDPRQRSAGRAVLTEKLRAL